MLFNFFLVKKNFIFLKQNIYFVFWLNKITNLFYNNLKKTNVFFFEKYTIEYFFFYIFKKFF